MEWLLGSGAAIGTVAVSALAFFLWRMAKGNRSDLHKLVTSERDLSQTKAQLDAQTQAVADRDQALSGLQRELTGSREANAVLRKALAEAQKALAESGDPSGVVHSIAGAFERLRLLSEKDVPASEAPEGGGDS